MQCYFVYQNVWAKRRSHSLLFEAQIDITFLKDTLAIFIKRFQEAYNCQSNNSTIQIESKCVH